MPTDWTLPPPQTSHKPTLADADWLRTAAPMTLGAVAVSAGAVSLIEELGDLTVAHEISMALRKSLRRAANMTKLKASLAVIVGGVLLPWGREERPAHHSLGLKELAGPVVGARATRAAIEALHALGFIHWAKGRRHSMDFGDGGKLIPNGYAPRFWPTPALLVRAAAHGITPDTIKAAFKVTVPTKAAEVLEPVVLREFSRTRPGQRPIAKLVNFNLDGTARALRDHVEEVNAFAAGFDVGGCEAPRWWRTFKGRWSLGGRWFAADSGAPYQKMNKADRVATLTIDGEPVVELDVRASHMTIMHALLGLPLPPDDPYEGLGVPRDVAKAWITATLGKGSPVRKWSKDTAKDIPAAVGFDPVTVGQAIMDRFAFLKAPGEAVAAAGHLKGLGDVASPAKVLTHRLMGIEAAALTGAMDILRAQGILALPVHDALIVAAGNEAATAAALEGAFQRVVGITPGLKVGRSHRMNHAEPQTSDGVSRAFVTTCGDPLSKSL